MRKIYMVLSGLVLPFLASAQALPFTAADYNPSTLAMGGSYAVETSSTAYSSFGNIAAVPFSSSKMDVAAGYTLWEPTGVKTNVIDVAGAGRIGRNFAVAAGFSYGMNPEYELLDEYGMGSDVFKPSEMRIAAGFAWKFLPFLSIGANLGYASSKLADDATYGAFTADVFLMSQIKDFRIALGASNLGSSVTSASGNRFQLPSALNLGAGFGHVYGEKHGVEARIQGDYYFAGAFAASAGVSYSFNDLVFIRAGYRYGGKSVIPSFASVGAGVHIFGIRLDAAYLIAPKGNTTSNTLAISLGYSF